MEEGLTEKVHKENSGYLLPQRMCVEIDLMVHLTDISVIPLFNFIFNNDIG